MIQYGLVAVQAFTFDVYAAFLHFDCMSCDTSAWLAIVGSLCVPEDPSIQYLRLLALKPYPEWFSGPETLHVGYLDPVRFLQCGLRNAGSFVSAMVRSINFDFPRSSTCTGYVGALAPKLHWRYSSWSLEVHVWGLPDLSQRAMPIKIPHMRT